MQPGVEPAEKGPPLRESIVIQQREGHRRGLWIGVQPSGLPPERRRPITSPSF